MNTESNAFYPKSSHSQQTAPAQPNWFPVAQPFMVIPNPAMPAYPFQPAYPNQYQSFQPMNMQQMADQPEGLSMEGSLTSEDDRVYPSQEQQQMQQQQPYNLQTAIIQSAPTMLQMFNQTPGYFIDQIQSLSLNTRPPQGQQHPIGGAPLSMTSPHHQQVTHPFQQFMAQFQMSQQPPRQPQSLNGLSNPQQPKEQIQEECPDYNSGFCPNGPHCQMLHIKKPEADRPKKISEDYILKVQQYFPSDSNDNNKLTNPEILMQVLNSVIINKLTDTQSIDFSRTGAFSDVVSERSTDYYRDVSLKIEQTRPLIRGRTRFFILKSYGYESIQASLSSGLWATTAGPTKKLTNAFKNSDHVILIFSVNESRSFQGFALMTSEPDPSLASGIFSNTGLNSSIQYTDSFKVRWIITCDYPFKDLEHLPANPMNEDLPIKQSKNGQELPFKLGNYLCHLMYNQNNLKKKVVSSIDEINNEFQQRDDFTVSNGDLQGESGHRQHNNPNGGGGKGGYYKTSQQQQYHSTRQHQHTSSGMGNGEHSQRSYDPSNKYPLQQQQYQSHSQHNYLTQAQQQYQQKRSNNGNQIGTKPRYQTVGQGSGGAYSVPGSQQQFSSYTGGQQPSQQQQQSRGQRP